MNGNSIRSFLGANTPNGFFSYYEPFTDGKKTYIIKGGPGTGKSSMMKKIAADALNKGYFTEYSYCSSDPFSLDAIFMPRINTILVDGTPPHLLEPTLPGALGGIINLGDFWDEKKLASSIEDIKELKGKISKCFSQCYRYLEAAGSVRKDIKDTAMDFLLKEKADKFIKNFCSKNLPAKSKGKKGEIQKRFLSGVTPVGYISFNDTIYTLCDKVYVLKDEWHISSYFVSKIIKTALEKGCSVYAFYDPLSPLEPIHVAIPEYDFAVVTSTAKNVFEPNKTQRINLKRFINEDIYYSAKRISFAKKILSMCIEEACLALKNEKALHDDLEEYYIDAMDFSKQERIIRKYSDHLLK